MLRIELIYLVLILSSCAVSQPERWILPSGEKVVCQRYKQHKCGLMLSKCGDDKSVDFECVSDATYKGAGEYFEPDIYDEEPKVGVGTSSPKPVLLPATKPSTKEKAK